MATYLWWDLFSCHLLFLSFSILTLLHLHRYCVGSFLWTHFWMRRFFPRSSNYRKLHRRKSCGMFQASEILHTTSIFFFLMNSICQVICYDLLAFCFVLFHNVRNLFSWLLWDKRAPSDISCLCYFSLSPLSLWKQTNSRMAITNHCRPVPLLQIGDIGFVPHVNFHLLRGLDLSEVWRT